MSNELNYEYDDANYGYDTRADYSASRSKARGDSRNAPQRGRKRGKAPTSVNGMHRRRRRKMAW